jgi:TetR/AcrR family transcriptional regulator, cholesterol catabolism regulator
VAGRLTVAITDRNRSRVSGIGRRRNRAQKGGTDSYQQRRREIAHAAAGVFNKKGFRGTSLGAVAAELGIDRASLYYYIGSKEELFDEVVRDVTEVNVTRALAIEASDDSPPEKLSALIKDLMESYGRNYPLLYIYIRENLSHVAGGRSAWAAQMKRLNKRYEESAVAIIQQGMDDGTFRELGSARVIAFGILGMVGWTNRWFVPDRSPESAAEIGDGYAEVILTGLVSGGAPRREKRVAPRI